MNGNILVAIFLTAIIFHVHSTEFECTWHEYKGPLYSMIPGQERKLTGQAWPLMHKTITANSKEEALELCQQEALPSLEQLQRFWLQRSTKEWAVQPHKKTKESTETVSQLSEWYCKSEGSNIPLKILAKDEQEAQSKCNFIASQEQSLEMIPEFYLN